MKNISDQRCFNHANREAVAVCPGCRRSFCRECITEHEDRVLCAVCLNSLLKPSSSKRFRFTAPLKFAQFMLGFFTIWLCFYSLGKILLSIPSSFHEGTLWGLW
ncbi:MAG: rhomboid family protein [Nitrospira bacterium SG8_35_4]|nr:MAG: rhomboid family protein [Nitrospira bacterium SG8_35_4]